MLNAEYSILHWIAFPVSFEWSLNSSFQYAFGSFYFPFLKNIKHISSHHTNGGFLREISK